MRKKNLLLILATGLIFGMFSAAAGAVGYNFSIPQGNLLVHDVDVDGENTIVTPVNDEVLGFLLNTTDRKTQRFAFEVSEGFLKRYGADIGDEEAHWLGAGNAESNTAEDYHFRVNFIRGAGTVLFKVIKGNSARIAANGKVVRPLIVEFTANTVPRATSVNGILEISGLGRTQRVPFFGIVSNKNVEDGKQTKTCTILDDSAVIHWDEMDSETDSSERSMLSTTRSMFERRYKKLGDSTLALCAGQCMTYNPGYCPEVPERWVIPAAQIQQNLKLKKGKGIWIYIWDPVQKAIRLDVLLFGKIDNNGDVYFYEKPDRIKRHEGEIFLLSVGPLRSTGQSK